jgi:hypothetical protein
MRQIGRASKGKNERNNKQDHNGAKRECGTDEAFPVPFARQTRNRPNQELRRRAVEAMELAIVKETKTTMANARKTTTTVHSILGRRTEGQLSFQTQLLCFQSESPGMDKCPPEMTILPVIVLAALLCKMSRPAR